MLKHCARCNKSYETDGEFCPYCGKSNPSASPVDSRRHVSHWLVTGVPIAILIVVVALALIFLNRESRISSSGRTPASSQLINETEATTLQTGEPTDLVSSVRRTSCFDAASDEPPTLVGVVESRLFAGPPNYEEITTGDVGELQFLLRLDEPLCARNDEFIADGELVSTIHIVPRTQAVFAQLRRSQGRSMVLSTDEIFGAHTGHHRAPLVAFVDRVLAVGEDTDDPYAEAGTAATTVRAFYSALAAGNGREANQLLVPEKRELPSYTAENLSRFYGSLDVPLRLESLRPEGPNEFRVIYSFRDGPDVCNGLALVRTTQRNGRNLIERISAPNGC